MKMPLEFDPEFEKYLDDYEKSLYRGLGKHFGVDVDDLIEAVDERAEAKAVQAQQQRRVARVVIVEGQSVWLYQADDEPYTMFPGGGVEMGETPETGAIREAKEETGFDVELVGWLADFTDSYSFRSYYLAKRIGGEPAKVDEDGNRPVRVRLVPFQQAMTQLTSPFDRAALEMAMKAIAKQ
jgi:8-oxo-dGTP pyrophosphatase MutT (NUDIX family)